MRKTSVIAAAFAVVAVMVATAIAASGTPAPRQTRAGELLAPSAGLVQGLADFQVGVFRRDRTISTSSTAWKSVPKLGVTFRDSGGCLRNEVSTTISVGVVGAPVGMRVRINGKRLQPPGEIRFDPTGGNPSFTYTFIGNLGADPVQPTFGLQWRSPTGKKVTLMRGSMNLLVQLANCK